MVITTCSLTLLAASEWARVSGRGGAWKRKQTASLLPHFCFRDKAEGRISRLQKCDWHLAI